MPADSHDRWNRAMFERFLAEARGGSNEALGDLLQSHANYLLWLANHELAVDVRDKAGASDLVQQTFLHAQEGFHGFRGQSPEHLQGWLRKILLHNLANFQRDFLATEKRNVAKETPLEVESAFERRFVAVADDPSPSSIVRHDEETGLLLKAIDNLPDDYAQVIKLRYWERMTFNEIGQRMDRSAEAARKLWARALERLEQQLGSDSDD